VERQRAFRFGREGVVNGWYTHTRGWIERPHPRAGHKLISGSAASSARSWRSTSAVEGVAWIRNDGPPLPWDQL